MNEKRCAECGDELYEFGCYEYGGKIICEECLADEVYTLDNLIKFIDTDPDLQDEIYIEREFGVSLFKSSNLLRRYCRTATIEAWKNGRGDWRNLKRSICFNDFFEMCGAKRIEYFKED